MADAIEELRALAANAGLAPAAMRAYLTKVHDGAYTVTDDDFAELKGAGFSEDEIFEQTAAVALAEGLRRFDRAQTVIG
jgi:alkylhydroperoxidase family enzyme